MKTVALGEVAEINPRASAIERDETVSFVGMAQLDAGRGVASALDTRRFEEVAKGYTVFRNGDILAAKITPCWENGKVGQAQLDHPIGVGSTEFHVLRPSPVLAHRYLLHFLRQSSVRQSGQLRMTGSGGQRRVPVNFLQDLQVPLPSLDEQRRIAGILDHADALRAKRRQVLAHLDTLIQAIFHDMFGQLDLRTTVGDVALIQGGLQVSAKRSSLPVKVPYLRVANVHRGRLDLAEVKTLQATRAEVERTLLVQGDLLFVEGHANPEEVGRVALWTGVVQGCVHQNHLIRGRLDTTRLSPVFAEAWLNSPAGRSHFRRAGRTTSGLNTISASTVRSAPLPLPPLTLQHAFAARVQGLNQLRQCTRKTARQDDALFASIQSRAFRGGALEKPGVPYLRLGSR